MSEIETKFFTGNLAKVGGISAAIYILAVTGFQNFFVSLGVAPGSTIGQLLGALIVPIVPSYFIARYLAKRKGFGFLASWMVGAVIIVLIAAIGAARQT
jgi:hypothetical protein